MGLMLPDAGGSRSDDPTQPALLRGPIRSAYLEHGGYTYVVIVKAMAGELEAIRRLEAKHWERLTPLVEVTAGRSRQQGQTTPLARSGLPGLPARLSESFKHHPFFLDFPWLRADSRISIRQGTRIRT